MKNQTADSLIFLHMPKTAGQTLNSILYRYYKPEETYVFEGPSVTQFVAMDESERARLRLIRGHMHFGIHSFLPQTFEYMTVLRNPLERVISYYYYVKRSPDHYLYEKLMSANLSLEAFVTEGITKEMDNSQTRLLAGLHGFDAPFGHCPQELLDQAKRNLNEMSIVGTTERFDEFLILLGKHFGWKRLYYERKNVTQNRPSAEQLPASTIEAILELNRLDKELYAHASERLGQDLGKLAFTTAHLAANHRISQLYTHTIIPTRFIRNVTRRTLSLVKS